MALKVSKMCKLSSSDIKDNIEEYFELVKKVKVICLKCGRVSPKKKMVCSPHKV